MNHHGEPDSGYVLIVAIVVMMGMLALIIPLVKVNQRQQVELRDSYDEVQAQTLIDNFLHEQNDPDMMPQASRNLIMPGWQDFPLPVKSKITSSDNRIMMANPLPIFINYNSGVSNLIGNVATNANTGTSNISIIGNQPNGSLCFVGNSVFAFSGSSVIRYNKYGGFAHAHRAKDYIFRMGDYSYFSSLGTMGVMVNGVWNPLVGFEYNGGEIYLRLRNSVSVTPSTPIAFYYVDFFNNNSTTNYSVNYQMQMVDEASKINLNSIPRGLARALGIEQLYTANSTLAAGTYPFETPDAILPLVRNSGFGYEHFAAIRPYLTTHTYPDRNIIGKSEIYGTDTVVSSASADFMTRNPNVNDLVNLRNKTGVPPYMHPVNFNTASVYVMSKVFEGMGFGAASSLSYAQRIERYRSGEASGDNIGYFDGNENAFDGNDLASNTIYGSPEEEFLALMYTVAGAASLPRIRDHVYLYRDGRDFRNCSSISAPICFRSSDVRTRMSTASVTRQGRLTAKKSMTVVARTEHNYGNSTRIDLLIDAATSWRQDNSTFKGVEWRSVRPLRGSGSNYYFSPGSVPVPPSLLGLIGGGSFVPRSVSNFGTEYLVTTEAASTLDNIDFGIRLRCKDWSELVNITNPTPSTGNGQEPYYLPSANVAPLPEDAYYETVLTKLNARWVRVQWEERNDVGVPGLQLKVYAQGAQQNPQGNSARSGDVNFSSGGGVAARGVNYNILSDTIRIRFTFPRNPLYSPGSPGRGTPPWRPGAAVSKPYATPQLYRICVSYTIEMQASAQKNNTTIYETR